MNITRILGSVMGAVVLAGCTSVNAPLTTQFRMADPVVAPTSPPNPPYVAFERYSGKSHRGKYAQESVIALHPAQVRRSGFKKSDDAFVVWDRSDHAWDNRANLKRNSVYRLSLQLPADYEARRLALLRQRTDTLHAAIDEGEARLRSMNSDALSLLSSTARAKVIADAQSYYDLIDALKVDLVSADTAADQVRIRSNIDRLAQRIVEKEALLQQDDTARDKLTPLDLEETLVNQISEWREELAQLKQQIVALELMLQNDTRPFPRVVNGWLETMDVTTFTKVGAVPFSVEDQYLDWIRQDKVVTVVFYDPNEKPENIAARQYRDALPLYWPKGHLTVIEHSNRPASLPRDMHAGARARSKVDTRVYRGVTATTYIGDAGEERTYLATPAGDTMWVFGPDLAPPDNVEVWVENAQGVADQKLYPSDARLDTREASVMQIAGVEGGVLDPIREARKRGQIIAVAYLGNWRYPGDEETIRKLYNQAVSTAPQQVAYVDGR